MVLSVFASALLAFAAQSEATPFAQVFPSGTVLSAHTLRLSIRFRQVPDGAVLPRLALRSERGLLQDVFMQQELWSPDHKTLTLLFDPGRLKTGIGRHIAVGAPLEGHARVELTLEAALLKDWQVYQRP